MTTENKSELGRLSLIRTNNARRRRLSLLRRKATCPSPTRVAQKPPVSPARGDTPRGAFDSRATTLYSDQISDTISSARGEILVGACDSRADTLHSGRVSDTITPARGDDIGGDCDSRAGTPFGSVSVIGRRREMEDTVRAELGFMGGFDFYGVYDGHGGAWVAEACGERLHGIVAGDGGLGWEEVMVRCFGRMDEEVAEMAAAAEEATTKMVGSTAVVAVVGKDLVVVANCGDSRAVLSRGGAALPLSSDHKPDRPDELKRIEDAGGRVINWNGHRVLGVLNTSRSIGDQHLKPYVIPEPEVTITQRCPSDEFLILASDGLWDVVSNEVACQIVRRCLNGRIKRRSGEVVGESRVAEAAALLAEFAVTRGSDDNVSVLVVKL